MHPLIQALRSELVAIIKRIDNGNCDISDVDDRTKLSQSFVKQYIGISRCLSMWLAREKGMSHEEAAKRAYLDMD